MNRRRLRQAKERLKTVVDPKRFDMRNFQFTAGVGNRNISESINISKANCKTAGCFAGWLPTLFPSINPKQYSDWDKMVEGFFELTEYEAVYLWGPGSYFTKPGHCRIKIKISHVIEHIDNLLEGRV